jgi:hypothetical protein
MLVRLRRLGGGLFVLEWMQMDQGRERDIYIYGRGEEDEKFEIPGPWREL